MDSTALFISALGISPNILSVTRNDIKSVTRSVARIVIMSVTMNVNRNVTKVLLGV